MRKQFLFFSLLTMTACGQNQNQSSETKALVSQQQANDAFDIVAGINYLSFSWIIDGCYARSLYMSLELAAAGIPSSEHYVFGSLQPTKDVGWSYHVAPLLQVKDSTQEPWILDPAFEVEPLTRTEWINKDFAKGALTQKALKDRAANTTTFIRAGSAYFDETSRATKYETPEATLFTAVKDRQGNITALNPRTIDKTRLVENFEALPTFNSSDVYSSCTVMYKYIGNEYPNNPGAVRTKRDALIAATTRLVQDMDNLGKWTRNGLKGSGGNPLYSDTSSTEMPATECTNAMAGYYR